MRGGVAWNQRSEARLSCSAAAAAAAAVAAAWPGARYGDSSAVPDLMDFVCYYCNHTGKYRTNTAPEIDRRKRQREDAEHLLHICGWEGAGSGQRGERQTIIPTCYLCQKPRLFFRSTTQALHTGRSAGVCMADQIAFLSCDW